MVFPPLGQVESVDLVIHVLCNASKGDVCSGCPASRCCERQCETIGLAVYKMLEEGKLPYAELTEESN